MMLDSVENVLEESAALAINGMPVKAIRAELDRILRSRVFIHSHRIHRFLQFVVEESLVGQQHRLKEYLIGLEVFKRRETFDPRVDSIVRVEARRLRAKLEEYYRTDGRDDELRIELRKGSYIPLFSSRRAALNGYGHVPTPARRIAIAMGRFSTSNGEGPELVSDVVRRLTHVLISEGHCRVIADYDPNAEPGNSTTGAIRPDYILEGSLERKQDDVKVSLQLLSVSDGAYFWSESGDGRKVDGLARSINRALVTSSAPATGRRLQRHRGPSQSFDHYLRGRYLWKTGTPESLRNSVVSFTKAVERDSSFGAAWAALSESLLASSLFGYLDPRETGANIGEAARKAIELNEELPEAHVALGGVLSILDWDWEGGEREFQRAIQLDGRDPSVHLAYGLQLACRGMLGEAVAEMERALDLDPAALAANFLLGWLKGVSNRPDEAIARHTFISQLAPDFPLAYVGLGWAHACKGLFADAVTYFTNASQLLKSRTLLTGCLGYCYARMGQQEEALKRLAQLTGQPPSQYASPIAIAAIYAGLGDIDMAFNYLDQAVEAHDGSLPLMILNPEFDDLRSTRRYADLRRKMGLLPGS